MVTTIKLKDIQDKNSVAYVFLIDKFFIAFLQLMSLGLGKKSAEKNDATLFLSWMPFMKKICQLHYDILHIIFILFDILHIIFILFTFFLQSCTFFDPLTPFKRSFEKLAKTQMT